MFKAGEYIVLILSKKHNGFFLNDYCYKQREDNDYLRADLDSIGSVTNGWDVIVYNHNPLIHRDGDSYAWRYATLDEAEEYERLGKPYDTKTISIETIIKNLEKLEKRYE